MYSHFDKEALGKYFIDVKLYFMFRKSFGRLMHHNSLVEWTWQR